MNREALGRIVRSAWVQYCIEIGDTQPSHVAPWEALSEQDKEADRRIGEAVAKAVDAEVAEALGKLLGTKGSGWTTYTVGPGLDTIV